jgi:Domain of unknown function (DUF1995)
MVLKRTRSGNSIDIDMPSRYKSKNHSHDVDYRIKEPLSFTLMSACNKNSTTTKRLRSSRMQCILVIGLTLYLVSYMDRTNTDKSMTPFVLAFAPVVVSMLVRQPNEPLLKSPDGNNGNDITPRNVRNDRKNGGRGFGGGAANANSKNTNKRSGNGGSSSGMARTGSSNIEERLKPSDSDESLLKMLMMQDEMDHMKGRISQLENVISTQQVAIRKLTEQCKEMTEATKAFEEFLTALQQTTRKVNAAGSNSNDTTASSSTASLSKEIVDKEDNKADEAEGDDVDNIGSTTAAASRRRELVVEASFEDTNIFGTAPETVLEAADVAGASILSAVLAGHQRLLVDVRDAELHQSPETFVQFLELAILPVAAGLEGLRGPHNRLKIVFPTVSELLQYRKTMCLSAPEVVALSTLAFDPVEDQDNMVVIIAPAPDDDEGLNKMKELLDIPTIDDNGQRVSQGISKPVVVLNRHMVPVSGLASSFEVAYHLRLLSVQYMSSPTTATEPSIPPLASDDNDINQNSVEENDIFSPGIVLQDFNFDKQWENGQNVSSSASIVNNDDDKALFEAVIKHAQDGMNNGLAQVTSYGVTRAMVIRAYPHPWNVFVDTSPDDIAADFEVAAVFDTEPMTSEIHNAIVTCLEGSEQEDEVVAQQMQQAYEAGQLDRVAELLLPKLFDEEDDTDEDVKNDNETDDNDDDEPYIPIFGI